MKVRTSEVQDHMDGLAAKNKELELKNTELEGLYGNHAAAERDYNIEYARAVLELRMSGESITLAKDLAKGDKVIAGLFYEVRIAEGILNACRERIKDLRSAIDTYRSLLSFLKAEYERTN